LIFQKIHTIIWTWKSLQKSILHSFTIKKKFHANYKKIPCFMEMKSNSKLKSMVYPKIEYVVFYYQVPTVLLTSSKLCVLKNPAPLPQIFFLWVVPSHIIMIQNQQEFKIQCYNVPWAVLVLNALFIQIM
jgi:hypothetical protein